jgi:hypothetical protein
MRHLQFLISGKHNSSWRSSGYFIQPHVYNPVRHSPHIAFMCFMWISEQRAISLYNTTWFVFITETVCFSCTVRKKGKAIIVEALRVPGGWGSRISWQSAHEGGKVVSPRHWPPLPASKNSWYSYLLQAESTTGPLCGWQDYGKWKTPMTPTGNEPATIRFEAQCLNQLRHCMFQLLIMQW